MSWWAIALLIHHAFKAESGATPLAEPCCHGLVGGDALCILAMVAATARCFVIAAVVPKRVLAADAIVAWARGWITPRSV